MLAANVMSFCYSFLSYKIFITMLRIQLSHLPYFISSVPSISSCFEVSAFSICMCCVWRSAHMALEGLSTSPFAPQCHSFSSLFFSPLRAPEKPKKPVLYVHFISGLRSSEGGPGLLSQQRTTHHFLLSSLLLGLIAESKHSGSMILLVSQGRLFIQFSPQHCAVAKPVWSWEKKQLYLQCYIYVNLHE